MAKAKAKVRDDVTEEEARAVVQKYQDAATEQRRLDALPYIGRYFKTRNSYGGGEKKWWLYATVTGVDQWAGMSGWRFELRSDGMIEIRERDTSLYVDREGWREVTASEFWEAFAAIEARVAEFGKRRSPLRRRRSAPGEKA